jgi:hypothetical protein
VRRIPPPSSEEAVEKAIKEVKAYQTKIILYCSLRVFLETNSFSVLVENSSQRVGKDPDEPDIQVHGEKVTFIEEKSSLPEQKELLAKEIQDVIDYKCERLYRGVQFTPQVILLCPGEVYRTRRTALRRRESELAVLSYPYPIEDPIRIQLSQGQIFDGRLASILGTKVTDVEHARTIIPTVKFLKQTPPVPYSAWTIWQVVWASVPAFKEDFTVKHSTILKECQNFYPSWLSRDTEQITEGRVNDALELLRFVGWVDYEGKAGPQTIVQIHYAKGDKIRSEAFHFLARKYNELKRRKTSTRGRPRTGVARVKRARATEQDSRLTDYLPS